MATEPAQPLQGPSLNPMVLLLGAQSLFETNMTLEARLTAALQENENLRAELEGKRSSRRKKPAA